MNQNQDQSAQHKILIKNIRDHYTFSNILYSIRDFSKIKVLIVGETIIDQYVFCEALGKSGKEPILVVKDLKTEEYLGGAAALSKHISPFCNKISLLSMLGEKKEYLEKTLAEPFYFQILAPGINTPLSICRLKPYSSIKQTIARH